MKDKRMKIVLDVLSKNTKARDSQKALVLGVWEKELANKGVCFCRKHIEMYASSPSGIDRDRRRKEALKLYPRTERKYEAFKEYTDEFSDHRHLRQAGLL